MTETTTKHTPGPWRAWRTDEDGGTRVEYAGPDHHWHVATVYGNDAPCGCHGLQTANASLIAAAPDLLAALRDLLAFADSVRPGGGVLAGEAEMFSAARAAIARAEGTA